jgi:hypothetical protein
MMRDTLSRPVRRTRAALLLTLATACAPAADPRLDPEHAGAMRDSVGALLEDIAAGLAAEGPLAWLRYLEDSPGFVMVSDGQVVFPNRDSAQAFLLSFAESVTSMQLVWDSTRVEPLAPGIAAIAAQYHESITDTAGAVASFGGSVSGVARNRSGEWRFQHLHWSSPPGR